MGRWDNRPNKVGSGRAIPLGPPLDTMMFNLILAASTVAIVAVVGAVAHRFFSARQRIEIPPLRDKNTDLGSREPWSIALSVVSYFALFSGVFVGTYRRNMDLYAIELRIVAAVMTVGLLAALANRYFYRRWM